MKILHNKPLVTNSDISKMVTSIKKNNLANGNGVKKLEQNFSKYLGGGYSSALSSGTAALFFALKTLGKKRLTVGIPTYACSALLNAIFLSNSKPVLFDINEDTFNLEAEKINKKVDVLIGIHTYGSPLDILPLKKFCKIFIEDCCHSVGGIYNNSKLGSFGDISIFSFYATKIITCGHGGLIWSKKNSTINKVKTLREFDLVKKYNKTLNLKLTDFQAELALNQFKRIDKIKKRRNFIYNKFFNVIGGKFEMQRGLNNNNLMPYRFIIKLNNSKNKNKLLNEFYKKNIFVINPLQKFELLHRYLKLKSNNFPIAEKISDQTLSLPFYPSLKNNEINAICKTLKSF